MEQQKWRGMEKPKRFIIKDSNADENYAKFVVEPLERGYGVTLGNSLRRILLSSLPGAAVSSIKLDGVLHEFSTIPGVREDTVEIILNIKQLLVKMIGNGPEKIYISADGAKDKEVKAGDIKCSPNVIILKPDLHILTLNEDAKVNIEMEVTRGRGYVPIDKAKKTDKTLGSISIDACYTPVRKILYSVENTRVGQHTDFDRLIIEVWTNGSVTPEDAVLYSAKILRDHLSVFINLEEEPEVEEVKEDKEEEKINELLNKSVEELELSVRSYNCLKASNIKTIKELVLRSEFEMLKFRNFGRKSLAEIKDILKTMGLSFDMKIDSSGKIFKKDKGEVRDEA